MIRFDVYPQGKKRVVTFSYDDGNIQDERLIGLFNKYNVKATFHLNGSRYVNSTQDEKDSLKKLYNGHEISCHTLNHCWPDRMPATSIVREVVEDRKILEDIAGYPVIGMSYPCGLYNDNVIEIMKSCGIVYSRTTKNTRDFKPPVDFMEWHPTCHHNEAIEISQRYIDSLDNFWCSPMLYIWGHSHEMRCEEDWNNMEKVIKTVANNPKIWYATNIEIYNYTAAQKNLQISADESIVYNPSNIDVWVDKDNQIYKISSGSVTKLN